MNHRIKDLIKERGYTQQEFADKLGITRVGLSQLINGKPSYSTLEKISSALDVPMWQLFVSPEDVASGADFVAFIKDGKNIYHADSIEELEKIISEIKSK